MTRATSVSRALADRSGDAWSDRIIALKRALEPAELHAMVQFSSRWWAVVSWAVFALAWWHVTSQGAAPSLTMWLFPAALVPVVAVTTGWWVRHNRGIFVRKGPRRAVPSTQYEYTHDRRGRLVDLDPVTAKASLVTITIGPGTKHYTRDDQ